MTGNDVTRRAKLSTIIPAVTRFGICAISIANPDAQPAGFATAGKFRPLREVPVNRTWSHVADASVVTGAESGAVTPIKTRQWLIAISSSKLGSISTRFTAWTKCRPRRIVAVDRARPFVTVYNLNVGSKRRTIAPAMHWCRISTISKPFPETVSTSVRALRKF